MCLQFIKLIISHVRLYLKFILFIVVAVIFSYGLFYYWPHSSKALVQGVAVTVENGLSFSQVASRLHQKGIVRNRLIFYVYGRIQGIDHQLKAGQYFFEGSQSYYQILRKLVDGDIVTQPITFYEGMKATQIAGRLQHILSVDSTQFIQLVNDSRFCASLGIQASTLEGYLFPDTYYFPFAASAGQVIERMVARFHEVVRDTLIEAASEQGFDLHDFVTLASIVEGEAAIAEERPLIAALYLNRLKYNIALQADPTIQYIISDGPRRLLNKDLEIDSPYNTYLHRGLPYGPVNNPGLASMLAVLNPDTVCYLYMVANGDGSHTFSTNLDDHNRAKQRFDRIRRQVRKERINQR